MLIVAVTSAVTNFWCHELIVKVNNKYKNTVTQKNLFAISMHAYGKLAI